MTTIDRDSTANLGILAMFDAMFRPVNLITPKIVEPEESIACVDCGEDVDTDDERCLECQLEALKEDDYGMDDASPRICGKLYDGY